MDATTTRRADGRAAWLLAAVVLAAGAGCGGDAGAARVRLVVSVAPDVAGREAIDAVAVTLAASRTPATGPLALCEPTTCAFPTGDGVHPVVVEYRRGAVYAELALFRVVWSAGGVVQAERELAVPWPGAGAREVPVELEAPCVGYPCDPGLQCVVRSGVPLCAAVPFPGAFDDASLVDQGVPCGSDESPAACPAFDAATDAGADVPPPDALDAADADAWDVAVEADGAAEADGAGDVLPDALDVGDGAAPDGALDAADSD